MRFWRRDQTLRPRCNVASGKGIKRSDKEFDGDAAAMGGIGRKAHFRAPASLVLTATSLARCPDCKNALRRTERVKQFIAGLPDYVLSRA